MSTVFLPVAMVAEPTSLLPIYSLTVLPSSAVALTVGLFSAVVEGLVITGAFGGVVSRVISRGEEEVLVLIPLVAIAVMELMPSVSS